MRWMIDCKREDKSMQPGDKRESLRQRIRPVYLSDTSGIYQRLLMKKVVKHDIYVFEKYFGLVSSMSR